MKRVQELNSYLVVRRKGKLLLLKRHNDIWEFPGGGIEFGESPKEAAMREAFEETAIKAKSAKLLGVTSAVFPSKGKEKHAIYAVYLAGSFTGKAKLSSEHVDIGWFPISLVKKMKLGLNARPVLEMI
jgi:8-oxo-dGTP diphosphatase